MRVEKQGKPGLLASAYLWLLLFLARHLPFSAISAPSAVKWNGFRLPRTE